MTPTQMSVYRTGLSSDHTCGRGRLPVFPKASRTAWATEETGFHSAKVRRGPGRKSLRTNVFAMKVNGKMNMNEALFTTSTLPTFNPTKAKIHDMAYANSSNRRKPPIAGTGDVLIRHPTINPVTDITKIDAELKTTSLVVRPTRTADRAIGSDRNRSMMPLVMSSASPAPVNVEPKITVWAKTPAIRYSRYETPWMWMELPKMYAKSTTNMIGDMVVQIRTSGRRLILMRFRFAMTAPSAKARATRLIGRPPSPEPPAAGA